MVRSLLRQYLLTRWHLTQCFPLVSLPNIVNTLQVGLCNLDILWFGSVYVDVQFFSEITNIQLEIFRISIENICQVLEPYQKFIS